MGLPKRMDSYAYMCTLKIRNQLFILTTTLKTFNSKTNRAPWKRGVIAAAGIADTFLLNCIYSVMTAGGPTAGPGTVYSQRECHSPNS